MDIKNLYFDILSQFTNHFFMTSIILLLFNFFYDLNFFVINLILCLVLFCNLTLKRSLIKNKIKKKYKHNLKIITFNIWYKNKNLKKNIKLILDEQSDIIQFQEVTYKNFIKLKLLLKNYYKFNSGYNYNSKDFDNVIFSNHKLYNIYYPCKRVICAKIKKNNKSILILGVHFFPWDNIMNFKNSLMQSKYLEQISPIGKKNAILFGDLNLTCCSNRFIRFAKKQKLFSKYYFIRNSSWPDCLPRYLGIKIDHVLHSKIFYLSKEKVIGNFGSDHRCLITNLAF